MRYPLKMQRAYQLQQSNDMVNCTLFVVYKSDEVSSDQGL